jgi:cyclophilin family peptidyl-prolyl cis-trans isomerase
MTASLFTFGCLWAASAQDAAPAAEQPPAAAPAAEEQPATEEQPADAAPAAAAPDSEAKPETPAAAQGEGTAGPATAEFNRVFGEWRKLLDEMRQLRTEYRQSKPPRREEIEKRYNELIAQGDKLLPQLTDAGVKAYGEVQTTELTELLLNTLSWDVSMDNYEAARSLSKQLIDIGFKNNHVYDLAARSAFMVGDYADAEKFAKAAQEHSVITDETMQAVSNIDYYKEAWAKELATREAEAKADDLPRVLIKTTAGDIEIELFENEAPNTVANFISLVEKGFYNGVPFHRVIPGFMAQGGDPTGTGGGGPGYTIRDEVGNPNHRLHFRGSLSMAKTAAPDSGGSQFFLNFVPTQHLDGVHTVFGRVVKGMDVLAQIVRRPDPEAEDAPEPSKIVEAKVIRKRSHEYKPETLPDK